MSDPETFLADPSRIHELPRSAIPDLLGELARLQARLLCRLTTPDPVPAFDPPALASPEGGMKHTGLVLAVMMSVWLVGCGTMASIPRELGRSPTGEEQRIIETFVPRVIAAARQEGFTCAEAPVVMTDMPNDAIRAIARPSRNPCTFYIQLDPRFLRRDSPTEPAGDFAHELGHVMNGDWTPGRAAVPQIERERQADAVSIRILRRMGTAECLARIEHFRKIRAENIRAWGAEQRDTITTHPSYTERIRTSEVGCRP